MAIKLKDQFEQGQIVGKGSHTDGFYAIADALGFKKLGFVDAAGGVKFFTDLLDNFKQLNLLDDQTKEYLLKLKAEWLLAETQAIRVLSKTAALTIDACK